MTAHAITSTPSVLADALPGRLVRDAALVTGAAAIVGVAAQVSVPLPFTPVPLSLATLAVLLAGAALGPLRGAASMLLYVGAGMAGVPWFSEQTAGWAFPSFGYLPGFVVASAVVGFLAARGGDRTVARAALVMALGNACIYLIGVPWLAVALQITAAEALSLGLVPFLIGDVVKLVAAALLLPGAWRLIDRTSK